MGRALSAGANCLAVAAGSDQILCWPLTCCGTTRRVRALAQEAVLRLRLQPQPLPQTAPRLQPARLRMQ